ncbi:unnamed protein product [Gadus morhua 'NCC']
MEEKQSIIMVRKLGSYGTNRATHKKTTVHPGPFVYGLTWGVVLFSDGVFAKYSYSIFAILNSFEGLFLFIYFFKISQTVEAV